MKLPFPAFARFKSAVFSVQGAMTSGGALAASSTETILCYMEQDVKTIRSPEGLVTGSLSRVIVMGDVAGLSSKNKGTVTIDAVTYKIEEVKRFYNLDNTVHHLEVMVM